MSIEQVKKDGIAFFTDAIKKWNRLIELYNEIRESGFTPPADLIQEANEILAWFQDNYMQHLKYSTFRVAETLPSGKMVGVDHIFDVVFSGADIQRICNDPYIYAEELSKGMAHLRGHLASIRNLKTISNKVEVELPILRIRKMLSRCNLVIDQLRRRRKNKIPYLIEDEYDVQDLLHALLKLEFDDIRKEEWTPSYAGGASRIDLVLKKEKILIEVKKSSVNVREKDLGDQLLEDIGRYKEYPDANIIVCFIYDPEHWIENSEGLKRDLEKLSTKNLNVEVIICP